MLRMNEIILQTRELQQNLLMQQTNLFFLVNHRSQKLLILSGCRPLLNRRHNKYTGTFFDDTISE